MRWEWVLVLVSGALLVAGGVAAHQSGCDEARLRGRIEALAQNQETLRRAWNERHNERITFMVDAREVK